MKALSVALIEAQAGASAAHIAERRIKPVLSDLEANAGQEMDPLYIAYMIQHSLTRFQ